MLYRTAIWPSPALPGARLFTALTTTCRDDTCSGEDRHNVAEQLESGGVTTAAEVEKLLGIGYTRLA